MIKQFRWRVEANPSASAAATASIKCAFIIPTGCDIIMPSVRACAAATASINCAFIIPAGCDFMPSARASTVHTASAVRACATGDTERRAIKAAVRSLRFFGHNITPGCTGLNV